MPVTNEGGTRKRMKKNAHKKSKRQRGGNSKKQREGNSKNKKKDKYLFKAIEARDRYKVGNALNHGADVNARNKAGDTPLICAIKSGDIDMVYLLLEHPDINIELNVKKNKELALAEELTPEDEEQNGIPYAIEEYIDGKNLEAKEAKEALFDVANKIGTDNPNTNAAKVLGQTVTVTDKNGNTRDIHNFAREINEYVGGKRKTRKKNSRGRKPRKK
jgi:ankyrin repeat protein